MMDWSNIWFYWCHWDKRSLEGRVTHFVFVFVVFQRRQRGHKEDSLRVCRGQSQGGSDLCGGQIQPAFPGKHQSGSHTVEPERVRLCWSPVLCFPGREILSLAHCWFLSLCFHSEGTWAQTRWCTWLMRASARGRGPSISKPGPFYAACATCQVMNCSCSHPPKQPYEIRFFTVLSSVLCQSSASVVLIR